jgi:hypothetical protein
MSGHIEISGALLARLTAASPGAGISSSLIKYENLDPAGKAFVPPSKGLWYRAWFMPGEPSPAGIGADARNRFVGIFQVDVLADVGKGTKATDDEAERLRKIFARGTSLEKSGVYVNIKNSWVDRTTQNETAYYKQIVKVMWWADVEN